jgi:[ribosomal protein S18]-alanine N-acetyltransferase
MRRGIELEGTGVNVRAEARHAACSEPGATFRVRPAEARDADAIVAVAAASPGAAPWSASQYAGAASGDYQGWIAECEGGAVGFLFTRTAADEMEILNLAILPERRRLGLASQLIERGIESAMAAGATRAYLEVRPSNRAAIALYAKCGFAEAGRRTCYYSDPVEDALVLSRKLA